MHIHMAMVIRLRVQTAFWEIELMMCEIKAKLLWLSTALHPERSKIAPERRYSTPKSSGSSSRMRREEILGFS
jgi:hypothetical protein